LLGAKGGVEKDAEFRHQLRLLRPFFLHLFRPELISTEPGRWRRVVCSKNTGWQSIKWISLSLECVECLYWEHSKYIKISQHHPQIKEIQGVNYLKSRVQPSREAIYSANCKSTHREPRWVSVASKCFKALHQVALRSLLGRSRYAPF
jgi:hypothetical protein